MSRFFKINDPKLTDEKLVTLAATHGNESWTSRCEEAQNCGLHGDHIEHTSNVGDESNKGTIRDRIKCWYSNRQKSVFNETKHPIHRIRLFARGTIDGEEGGACRSSSQMRMLNNATVWLDAWQNLFIYLWFRNRVLDAGPITYHARLPNIYVRFHCHIRTTALFRRFAML